ncbi:MULTISPECIES: glycosyltransferase family 2 protein [Clostridia]|uniref:glycosyltransferase family 2 protein n=1 Tax=Clostridia TaxID=186801 RepID=UPI000E4D5BF5|nr:MULTISPECIES: glycosyltransferase family 2 protein [Clostridia]RHV71065.1 glycosyltransferase [Roseburia sp. OM02-15]
MKTIGLIIPCFNEAECLHIFDEALGNVIKELKQRYEFEVMYIDDGSTDTTLSIIQKLKQKHSYVRYISFSRNFGKEAAMYAGFCNIQGDYVAVMDADMQDPPSLLPDMVEILEKGEYDSVATRRVTRTGEPKLRSFCAKLFYQIINRISDADVVDGARDFRLMKRSMVDAIIELNEYNRFSKGIFGWIGFRTYWYEYENVERCNGSTKWNFWGLFHYSIDGIVNFSQFPLSITSYAGLVITALSLISIIAIFLKKILMGDPVQGWASTACIILFMGGINLFSIGIMGQYVGKNYAESKKRPHYIAKEVSDDKIKKIR